MADYCRNCTYHHNAGHPKGSPLVRYNDWCTRWSGVASRKVGHCKLHKGRTLRRDADNESPQRNEVPK